MDEIRAQAALTELNTINQVLIQRCINLAVDLALARTEIASLGNQLEDANKKIEEMQK